MNSIEPVLVFFNPFEHTTKVFDLALEGGFTFERWNLLAKTEWLKDDIEIHFTYFWQLRFKKLFEDLSNY